MRTIIKLIAPALLILLFTYAAASKLFTFDEFSWQLHNQNISGWLADLLLYTLIPAELLIAALLLHPRTQRVGLLLSVITLAVFTGYILLILAGAWDRVPCSCGGVIGRLNWTQHFFFNLFFLVLSIAGWRFSAIPGHSLPTVN
ncbi:MauE/DoxX family redox-associated membrane protein [Mucilaginibacter gynuensis]|uniref:MauE/DoxX family redox-associated membrane protein n=1 Tax=Mucilaginibacter gynuensis TaxID=1302236 RepID=UPI0031EA142B